MSGLVGVLAIPEAAALVRRATEPMLRRPFQRRELAAISADVALGFAGERGAVLTDPATGVVAAIDGELFTDDGPATGADAAAVLLRAFLADGDLLEPPEGRFAAAFWDARRNVFTVLTDRQRRRHIYLARHRGGVVFAGELKALLAAGIRPELDLQGWSELLAYEHLLGDRTPLAGIRRLPAASTLTISRSGEERLERRWRYRLVPEHDADEDALVDGFARVFERAVRNRLDPTTALALSGGLDSRSVASVLLGAAPHAVAITYGAPGSRDLRIGARVAARTQFEHRPAPFMPGYIARGAADTVWLAEGHIRCFHTHHLSLRRLRLDGMRSVLISYAGDHTVRTTGGPAATGRLIEPDLFHRQRAGCLSDELLEQLLTPSFAAMLRGRARDAMAMHLAAEEGTALERLRQLLYDTESLKIHPGAELFADDLAPRDPFDDAAVVDFCRRMPEAFRRGGRLQRAYLTRFPELASIPNTKDHLAPSVNGTARKLATKALRVREAARAHADDVLGPAWWPSNGGLGDYAADLRASGGDLLAILLEPRTLDRGQLRGKPLRRVVEDTLRGRARHTRLLGMLLTFELFQRQFVDGDGEPSASLEHDTEPVAQRTARVPVASV